MPFPAVCAYSCFLISLNFPGYWSSPPFSSWVFSFFSLLSIEGGAVTTTGFIFSAGMEGGGVLLERMGCPFSSLGLSCFSLLSIGGGGTVLPRTAFGFSTGTEDGVLLLRGGCGFYSWGFSLVSFFYTTGVLTIGFGFSNGDEVCSVCVGGGGGG
jgi:hypothetical protein